MKNSLISRFEVAQFTGNFPPDLVEEIRTVLLKSLPVRDRRAYQDGLIREAAKYLRGSAWHRAEQLSGIIKRWTGRQQSDPIKALLYRATATGLPLPASPRQIHRKLTAKPFTFQ